MQNIATIFRASAIVGIEDLRALYTWRTWVLGWLMRVLFQVLFFASIGRYLGVPDRVRFLLVGGAGAIAVLESFTLVIYTAFDRALGVQPLLASSPGDYFLVVLARNVNCICTGVLTSTISLFTCSYIMDSHLIFPSSLLIPPVMMLGAISTYFFVAFLCAFIIKISAGRWLILNIGYLSITAFGGFYMPADFWPLPLRWLSAALPFTHALRAVRGLAAGQASGSVLAMCGLELLVAAGWLVAGRVAFGISIARARRDGSIDLAPA